MASNGVASEHDIGNRRELVLTFFGDVPLRSFVTKTIPIIPTETKMSGWVEGPFGIKNEISYTSPGYTECGHILLFVCIFS